MPDNPTHDDQPTETPTSAATTGAADTTEQATTDPAPTTTAAPEAAAGPTAGTAADTAATTGAQGPGQGAADGDHVAAEGDLAATPSSPEPEGRQPSAQTPRSRRRRSTRTAATPRRPATPAAPPASAPGRVSDTAHDRVWAALRSHPGSTPAELSTTSGVARSTVAKLLTAWAADGSVTSTPGGTGRAGRAPNRWTAAPSDLPPATTATETTPAGGALPRTGQPRTGQPRTRRPRGGAADSDAAPVNGAGRNQSGNSRLAAGALQGMVQDFLTEHPGDHGPTAIGRALARSSGAVANALERLVTAGWAVRTNDRPRRYRTTEPPDATTTRG